MGREFSEELVRFHRLRQVLREQNNFGVELLVTFVVLISTLELQHFRHQLANSAKENIRKRRVLQLVALTIAAAFATQ
jgi:hypothetical protein